MTHRFIHVQCSYQVLTIYLVTPVQGDFLRKTAMGQVSMGIYTLYEKEELPC